MFLDVVYNHVGPNDNALWQFDGWTENGMGGIYFYNDWRAETPWGDSRPELWPGRGEAVFPRQRSDVAGRVPLRRAGDSTRPRSSGTCMAMTTSDQEHELPEGWGFLR